jgi:hypothetical protein
MTQYQYRYCRDDELTYTERRDDTGGDKDRIAEERRSRKGQTRIELSRIGGIYVVWPLVA